MGDTNTATRMLAALYLSTMAPLSRPSFQSTPEAIFLIDTLSWTAPRDNMESDWQRAFNERREYGLLPPQSIPDDPDG